jgi:hypothetical protein
MSLAVGVAAWRAGCVALKRFYHGRVDLLMNEIFSNAVSNEKRRTQRFLVS